MNLQVGPGSASRDGFIHDIFLLMINLSQIHDQAKVLDIFTDAINGQSLGFSLTWVPEGFPAAGYAEPIRTSHSSFGTMEIRGDESILAGELGALLRNAMQMLAIILENLRQWQLLEGERHQLAGAVLDGAVELELSERKYRNLIETMNDGFIIRDPGGRISYANPRMCSMLGLPAQALVGGNIEDFLGDGKDAGGSGTSERVFRRADGRDLYAIVSVQPVPGSVGGDFSVVTDISDRKKAESALESERERLSVTLRSIGDGVISTDTAGRVSMMNKAAERITGWALSEAVGLPLPEVFRIVDGETGAPLENPAQMAMRTGCIATLVGNAVLLDRSGARVSVADSGAPIRDSASTIIGAVLVFRDDTEKRRVDEALRQTQRLESLGILAGGIAHDFNNLLGGVFGYIDLARSCGDEARRADYLEKAFSVYGRAKGLTMQLLTFAKGGDPVRETGDLGPILENCAKFALSGTDVTCRLTIAEDLWPCDFDQSQMNQVIDNLLINARQAMPGGGTVSISAANEVSGTDKRFVRITVSDIGTGIPPEVLPRIFDPFFTTKRAGHGLGLSTVFSILQKHGGSIEAQSELGKGTTFTLRLPASRKATEPATVAAQAGFRGHGRVLVMDDEDFIQEIARNMLERMGFTVDACRNAAEALGLAARSRSFGGYLAAILDLTIPGGPGGRDIVQDVRSRDTRVVIIASSGYSEDPVMSRPAEFGFDASIRKPYDSGELARLFAAVLPIGA